MLRTVPALLPVAELVRFSNVPVVIDEVTSEKAVCVLSDPHCQAWAKFVLLIVFVASAEVMADRDVSAPATHPLQVPVMVMLLTVVVPANDVLPPTARLLVILTLP